MRYGWCCGMLALAACAQVTGLNQPNKDFVSAETCRPCHSEIYQQWRQSFHSQAATDSVFWRIFEQAARRQDNKLWALCLTCHAPVATVTGQISPVRPILKPPEMSPVAREGVTCDFCHTVSGKENLGKNVSLGAYRFPHRGQTNVKYGTHPDAKTSAHATQTSEFLKSPQLCAICHQLTHPLPGLEFQNTYSEWYYGPYRSQGRTCQDCHMPAYAGKAADDGPERADLNAHVFQGGHTGMLQRAAQVTVWAKISGKAGARRASVNALVTNAGSGHLLPTGIPGIRELWLDFSVRTSEGTELSARRVNYGVTLLDKEGKPALPWRAVRLGTDTRIAPQRSRREMFQVSVPDGKPVHARATLYYRVISELAAKEGGISPTPPIVVAADRIEIAPDGSVKKLPLQ